MGLLFYRCTISVDVIYKIVSLPYNPTQIVSLSRLIHMSTTDEHEMKLKVSNTIQCGYLVPPIHETGPVGITIVIKCV